MQQNINSNDYQIDILHEKNSRNKSEMVTQCCMCDITSFSIGKINELDASPKLLHILDFNTGPSMAIGPPTLKN